MKKIKFIIITTDNKAIVKEKEYKESDLDSIYSSLANEFEFDWANEMATNIEDVRMVYDDGRIEGKPLNEIAKFFYPNGGNSCDYGDCILFKGDEDGNVEGLSQMQEFIILERLKEKGVEIAVLQG